MRPSAPMYPVDRYLVESSNNIEMVNIIDEDLWKAEPAMRPEDELVLRHLQAALQDTAAELRALAGDLAPRRRPAPHLASLPTPLDQRFNDQLRIQQLVDAKLHQYQLPQSQPNLNINATPKVADLKPNIGVQMDSVPLVKKANKIKNLGVTRTRILEIKEKSNKNSNNKLNNAKVINKPSAVVYNEYIYEHEEPRVTLPAESQSKFKIQDMPSINIRSELREQKVLQLDIYPDIKQTAENIESKTNVAVVAVEHATAMPKQDPQITLSSKEPIHRTIPARNVQVKVSEARPLPVRKVSKMSACDSSGSNNNESSDTQHKLIAQKKITSVIKSSPKISARDRLKTKKVNINKVEPERRHHLNLDEWKSKLNTVYGQSPVSKKKRNAKQVKKTPKQNNLPSTSTKPSVNILNNGDYIPYSQLTLGGARVSDVEREISNIRNKNDMPLSPILDKILSSRESSPRKPKKKHRDRIFTTSDENLLEEVIDIERKVSKTIAKNTKRKIKSVSPHISSDSKEEKDSYADDFEEDKTDNSEHCEKKPKSVSSKSAPDTDNDNHSSSSDNNDKPDTNRPKKSSHDVTYTKTPTLAIKNSVDIFEFVHSVDTQDTATQSNTTNKISLKETQTSPRAEKPNIQPIHNDLWPLDPKGEVEKMFKLEKDFIKKLILEEYSDILEKNLTKPSTSKENGENKHRNVAAAQKLTQTSPAHVKSVMTSPTKTKTRTTSPFLSVRVDHQTSPMVVVSNEEHLTVQLDNDDDGISINLSSPRFNLRLPQSSREVLSNLDKVSPIAKSELNSEAKLKPEEVKVAKPTSRRNRIVTSSSSDVENSSEMSSLGEVRYRLKRYRKRVSSISESSESSGISKYSTDLPSAGVIPLRSEGEVSLSIRESMRSRAKANISEGEANLRRS